MAVAPLIRNTQAAKQFEQAIMFAMIVLAITENRLGGSRVFNGGGISSRSMLRAKERESAL